MNTLPVEILENIFNYLDIKSFIQVKLCNKELNTNIKDTNKDKWMETIPRLCRGNRWTLVHTIKDNRLDYFKWGIKSNLPYDAYMSLYASKLGRLTFLNYIHEKLKYSYDKRILCIAKRDNHPEIIEWCLKYQIH